MSNGWIGNNNKAAAILRVSTRKQNPKTQENEVRDYCSYNGLDLVDVFYIKESGKDSDKRAQYKAAIDACLKKGIRHIVFLVGDREARNNTDLETNEKLVKKDKIVLHYALERKVIHKFSPDSDFLVRDIGGAVNKDFSRKLSTRMEFVMREKAKDGQYPGNRPPLGYVHRPLTDDEGKALKRGTVVVADPNVRVIQQVNREFELRSEGWSFQAIRDKIVEEGFITPSKVSQYRANTVEKRLSNQFYWGHFTWQGVPYRGNHPLIVPKELLNAVAKIKEAGTFGQRATYGSKPKGIFGGEWLHCHQCGCSIIYEPREGTARVHHYYRCTNGKKEHATMKGMFVREEQIWEQFGKAVERITIDQTLAEQIMEALNEAHLKTM